jgi:hypothetical protein
MALVFWEAKEGQPMAALDQVTSRVIKRHPSLQPYQ